MSTWDHFVVEFLKLSYKVVECTSFAHRTYLIYSKAINAWYNNRFCLSAGLLQRLMLIKEWLKVTQQAYMPKVKVKPISHLQVQDLHHSTTSFEWIKAEKERAKPFCTLTCSAAASWPFEWYRSPSAKNLYNKEYEIASDLGNTAGISMYYFKDLEKSLRALGLGFQYIPSLPVSD